MWEEKGEKLRDKLENCLKMRYFQIFPQNFYNWGKFSVQKYTVKGLPTT